MGLDAVVYRNLANLPKSLRAQVELVDPETGEVDFLSSESGVTGPVVELTAANVRLGNIAMISWLAQEIRSRCSTCSLLLEVVLYNGSHSGDFVAVQNIVPLEQEVKLVRVCGDPLPVNLKSFLDSMLLLIEKAKEENNPIVFV